jgi:beta-glucosidase
MTLEEKVAQTIAVWQMLGSEGSFSTQKAKELAPHGIGAIHRRYDEQSYEAGASESNAIQKHFIENTRLGIPVLINTEGLHGVWAKNTTIFPSAIGLASTWDTELFSRIYTAVALESRALGIQHLFSPNLDVTRDPRWGRVDENFGEDPYLISRLGVAFIKAAQGPGDKIDHQHVAATAKHFSAFGQPMSGINKAPANISRREIRSAFLPPFEAAVKEANVRLIMPSYSEIDGIPVHKNHWLMHDILRDEYGFDGVVLSDYGAVNQLYDFHHVARDRAEAARLALKTGIDFDLDEYPAYCYPTLVKQIQDGKIPASLLDESVRRILRLKFELGLFDDPYVDPHKAADVINNPKHQELALEAAHKSMVLLKNEGNTLPLNKNEIRSIAVIGPNADVQQFGRYIGTNDKALTVLEGIKRFMGEDRVKFARGCHLTQPAEKGSIRDIKLWPREDNLRLIDEAVEVAKTCDAIILAIGSNTKLCREAGWGNTSGDRSSLELVGEQKELAKAMLNTGKKVVVLLFNGRPLSINWMNDHVPAIIECWHPGEATGKAVTDVLFGNVNPSGKLPITFPASVGHIPSHYNREPSADLKYVINTKQYLYPFGYGLSYTQFAYSGLKVDPSPIKKDEHAKVMVKVKNTGQWAGDEIVQLYIRDLVSSATRPMRELKGFQRITLEPGESKNVSFEITPEKLAFYNDHMDKVVEPGMFYIMAGPHSMKLDTVQVRVK